MLLLSISEHLSLHFPSLTLKTSRGYQCLKQRPLCFLSEKSKLQPYKSVLLYSLPKPCQHFAVVDHNLVKNVVCLSLYNVICTMCVSVYNCTLYTDSRKKVGSWDPGILDPSPFLAKIRKVEARLGKFIQKIGKLEVRPNFGKSIRKIEPN